MPIIKATSADGQNHMAVIREESREETIKEFKDKGLLNIHDDETGEKYN